MLPNAHNTHVTQQQHTEQRHWQQQVQQPWVSAPAATANSSRWGPLQQRQMYLWSSPSPSCGQPPQFHSHLATPLLAAAPAGPAAAPGPMEAPAWTTCCMRSLSLLLHEEPLTPPAARPAAPPLAASPPRPAAAGRAPALQSRRPQCLCCPPASPRARVLHSPRAAGQTRCRC